VSVQLYDSILEDVTCRPPSSRGLPMQAMDAEQRASLHGENPLCFPNGSALLIIRLSNHRASQHDENPRLNSMAVHRVLAFKRQGALLLQGIGISEGLDIS
jgi:hypothetical protein